MSVLLHKNRQSKDTKRVMKLQKVAQDRERQTEKGDSRRGN